MHHQNIREQYANSLMAETSTWLQNFKPSEMPLEEAYLYYLNANEMDVNICMHKIAQFLPDEFYLRKHTGKVHQINMEIVKCFILFMAQEDITSSEFKNAYENFLYDMLYEIGSQYHLFEQG